MVDKPSKDDKSQNFVSEFLDDEFQDFEDSEESTVSAEVSPFSVDDNTHNLKENVVETMQSIMKDEYAELAAGFQEFINDEDVIQETLKHLSELENNLPEGSDNISTLFANMIVQDDINDKFPMLKKVIQPLLSKKILYPFVNDFYNTFSKWLEENETKSDEEEFENYIKIFDCIKEIKDHLDNQEDTDDEITKTRKFKELMKLLVKIRDYGQVPDELLKDVADEPSYTKSNR